jgi:hypothetical protein
LQKTIGTLPLSADQELDVPTVCKLRPSRGGMVKDSIHLEHYLELCRQLHASGSPGRRVFVSANKADFWEAKNSPVIHPDLEPQLTAVDEDRSSSEEFQEPIEAVSLLSGNGISPDQNGSSLHRHADVDLSWKLYVLPRDFTRRL